MRRPQSAIFGKTNAVGLGVEAHRLLAHIVANPCYFRNLQGFLYF